ncbi:28S ribosomal protein S29, mitochondrial [Episyrphus balteatus]|uniref:28S ribosomal protein S29, mitochondrial n=1 Tax=Episyrphus balteatus TaxID=286459 RepID=UPI0024869973|nr:28S ribosomal protein S29, mitochondrial [Episyrphus balteatus]
MFIRQISRLPPKSIKLYSTSAEPAISTKIPKSSEVRTNEGNTSKHSSNNLGKYYQIPNEDKKILFSHGGLPKSFEKQAKTFGETCLMVRQPALEVIDYIKSSNLNKPTVRYVLYGDDGVGKSLTMAHIIHYGYQNGFLLLHAPWVANWYKRPKETANSTSMEGFIDLPFDAAGWLVHFKTQNAKLLPTLDLKTTKDYVWSKRETTPAGSTLLELIEHGIARIKFASDTIAALISELKQHATGGKCKIMVAMDGYNAFFHPITRVIADNKAKVHPSKVTLTQPFLDITNYDWCNGVCILSVDKLAASEGNRESYLPRYLLEKEGFEHLDPFVPIRVDNFNEKEFKSCIDYYLDRRWIQNNEPGFDQELKYLSASNPFRLMNICAPL